MVQFLKPHLVETVEIIANRREIEALKHPEDRRTLEASQRLNSLALSLRYIDDPALWCRLDGLYEKLGTKAADTESQFLSDIGYQSDYTDGRNLIHGLISKLESLAA